MLLQFVDTLFLVYMIMLFVRIMSSWFPEYQDTKYMRFVAYYTDPYLNIFRKIIPPLGMMDFSPVIAFFALQIIEVIVKTLIVSIGL